MSTADEGNIRTWPAFIATAETGSNTDKQQNATLCVVADELGHRLKNFVAIIQSIARQTMHQSATKDDFEVRFSGRLAALGRSLDLLITNDWCGARLDELVRSELTPFGAGDGVQISVKGPAVGLNPDAARNIGLALHELATNASKYGALSVPAGKVAVRWQLTNGGRRFRMTWREFDGPIVMKPKRWGFGRRIIQEVAAQALAGKVAHEFPPSGVRWTLDVAAASVVGPQTLERAETYRE
jgi:two-component sensor histidine kinase